MSDSDRMASLAGDTKESNLSLATGKTARVPNCRGGATHRGHSNLGFHLSGRKAGLPDKTERGSELRRGPQEEEEQHCPAGGERNRGQRLG